MCGVFGIYGIDSAPYLTYLGIWNLQHRGGETAGIVASDGCSLTHRIKQGSVAEVFRDESKIQGLEGHLAVGHVRYPTAGSTSNTEADGQPLMFDHKGHKIILAMNGHIYNAGVLRRKLEDRGAIFKTSSDTEVILHLALTSLSENIEESMVAALRQVKGSYCLVMGYDDALIVARDPNGYRPMCMGQYKDAVLFSSESISFDAIGADYLNEVRRGELLKIDKDGIRQHEINYNKECFNCVMELLYFANPGSLIYGLEKRVKVIRDRFGTQLGEENDIDCDIIVPVPESGCDAAEGLHEKTGIPLKRGIIKNRNSGRQFLPPRQDLREIGVFRKYIFIPDILAGHHVGEVDDTIVRATTSKRIVRMSRESRAKRVTFIVSAPPYIAPCHWGIDTPTREELIAAGFPEEGRIEGVRNAIGADSLIYLSHDGMVGCVPEIEGLCTRCFTDVYPEDLIRLLHDERRLDCR